jgi:hypothetical protein
VYRVIWVKNISTINGGIYNFVELFISFLKKTSSFLPSTKKIIFNIGQ